MPTEKMRRRLDRLRGNMLEPSQIPGAIRDLTTLLAHGVKTEEKVEEIAKRYEPVLGLDGARELRRMLIWGHQRIMERGGLYPALYGADILWSETWTGVPSSETLM